MHQRFLAAMIALCGVSGAAAAEMPTADSLIAAAKAASGGAAWDRIATWHETGHITAGGLSGTYESWIDFRHPREAATYKLGPTSGAEGYDGHVTWTTDSSTPTQVETGGEAMAGALQQLYLFTYAFYFPDRMRAKRSLAGMRQADGRSFDAVRVEPAGADPVELWFDRTTHLLDREVQLTGAQPQTFLLSNYISIGDIKVPARSITRTADNPKLDQVNDIGHVALNETISDARYAPPKPPTGPPSPAKHP